MSKEKLLRGDTQKDKTEADSSLIWEVESKF